MTLTYRDGGLVVKKDRSGLWVKVREGTGRFWALMDCLTWSQFIKIEAQLRRAGSGFRWLLDLNDVRDWIQEQMARGHQRS